MTEAVLVFFFDHWGWLVVGGFAWMVGALAVGSLIGRGIKTADEREGWRS
jgi:hypothetical protein